MYTLSMNNNITIIDDFGVVITDHYTSGQTIHHHYTTTRVSNGITFFVSITVKGIES